jgi:hypothetical protein
MATALFPKNESAFDRGVRIFLGLALLSLAFTGPRTAWGYIGLIPLFTGLLGTCPLYTVFGMSTCRPHNA